MNSTLQPEKVQSPEDTTSASETRLRIEGMTCANCARHVTEALSEAPGVSNAIVSLAENSAQVRWKPDSQPNLAPLLTALEEAGYRGSLIKEKEPKPASKWSPLAGWQFNVAFGAAVLAPMMILE